MLSQAQAANRITANRRYASTAWSFVSTLNARHMQLAWITLGTLAFTDFYIMALSAGWFGDLRFIN